MDVASAPDRDRLLMEPRIEADRDGWTWIAKVREDVYTWTRLDWSEPGTNGEAPSPLVPEMFEGCPSRESPRGADVTWRCAERMAGEGHFLLGDAAMVLDPASSQGVLRALLSGAIAAEFAARTLRGEAQERDLALSYDRGMKMRFHDARLGLRRLYREHAHPPEWIASKKP